MSGNKKPANNSKNPVERKRTKRDLPTNKKMNRPIHFFLPIFSIFIFIKNG